MGIHVVVGANGATGTVLCRELLAAGHTVRAVSRSGRGAPSGVDEIAADATDAVRITEICAGATSLYHCALPPMGSWLPTYVDLTRSLITAAGNVGARLVYADDTWMYGKVNGPMREDSPVRPVAYKGALRALAAEMIASAYARGQTESVVGRAAELYGPRVESLLGAGVFAAGITGRKAIWPGDPDLPMTATFIGDFGKALADLGQHPAVVGQVFHVPVAPPITGRQFIELIASQAGTVPKVGRLTPPMVALVKVVAPIVREGAELLYQFEQPFLVDDSRFRALTGRTATTWRAGIEQTITWYRADPERIKYRLLPGKSR
ncbi:NAD-dependent epimerase/dehydratase family protein [Mycobacteroides abscessus]|uniref:NAD-dependent epimerase/dehydratase family protein n=1 Tax=Mycobacteroides abscessus TaxID=36809 RepID=UPI000929C46B|nr:NAD-dependent epimerase/dehydratase family protein [Mycobacteroides abscessus]SHT39183.1 UDP-glucose 4-epimerase GalE4 [Mycobacteroides abscessus subsp. abscessus]SHT44277.1 UDP-glucose 4-epimerase GalE4 [Mycobacteroides abscessus subsp. abscessus]SHT67658.1 UDP-glucose 4-epimerase GalE4 [Mycobacteroides abscessus subsp. abscessus]SHW07588.1 UDP-glucose 4-epimerase GalE4 [Mycobacteroides abscessus subsp. abscessus]SIA56285.1 UDP-glucose 4-epimerase GalE4 [Mycobacteroides abscessus subsp. ab